MDTIVDKVLIYGNKDGIQPEVFVKLGNKDALYAIQIATHYYGGLYLHGQRLLLIADGLNHLYNDPLAEAFFKEEFPGVKFKQIPSVGQNQENCCASSAAAILIEFQKVYKAKSIPDKIIPAKVTFARVQATLHKIETERITTWKSLD